MVSVPLTQTKPITPLYSHIGIGPGSIGPGSIGP